MLSDRREALLQREVLEGIQREVRRIADALEAEARAKPLIVLEANTPETAQALRDEIRALAAREDDAARFVRAQRAEQERLRRQRPPDMGGYPDPSAWG